MTLVSLKKRDNDAGTRSIVAWCETVCRLPSRFLKNHLPSLGTPHNITKTIAARRPKSCTKNAGESSRSWMFAIAASIINTAASVIMVPPMITAIVLDCVKCIRELFEDRARRRNRKAFHQSEDYHGRLSTCK